MLNVTHPTSNVLRQFSPQKKITTNYYKLQSITNTPKSTTSTLQQEISEFPLQKKLLQITITHNKYLSFTNHHLSSILYLLPSISYSPNDCPFIHIPSINSHSSHCDPSLKTQIPLSPP